MRDHYQVLQVDRRADPDVIRAAYRVLARRYHPDHGGDAQLMIALNDAWDVLGDPSRRVAYDARLGGSAAQSATPSGGASPASGAGTSWSSAGASSDSGTPRAGPPPGNPSGTVLDFGQYQGWSLGEIARHDSGYLEWLQRAPSGRRLRTEIDLLLRQRRGSPPTQQQGRFRR